MTKELIYNEAFMDGVEWAKLNAEPTNFRKVREFESAFSSRTRPTQPTLVDDSTLTLRLSLIQEELDEFVLAHYNGDIVGVADGLADLLYVVYGTAIAYGINIDKTFKEVHRSNMTKLGEDGKPVFREDGKVLKGPNYEPPNIEENM